MASNWLKSLSVAIGLLSNSDISADARRDWVDYAWTQTTLGTCNRKDGEWCLAASQNWDWKRPQWIELWQSWDSRAGILNLRLVYTNNSDDTDYVCTTVLLTDGDGEATLLIHAYPHVIAYSKVVEEFELPLTAATAAQSENIFVGTRQCWKTGDQAIYDAVQLRMTAQ